MMSAFIISPSKIFLGMKNWNGCWNCEVAMSSGLVHALVLTTLSLIIFRRSLVPTVFVPLQDYVHLVSTIAITLLLH